MHTKLKLSNIEINCTSDCEYIRYLCYEGPFVDVCYITDKQVKLN